MTYVGDRAAVSLRAGPASGDRRPSLPRRRRGVRRADQAARHRAAAAHHRAGDVLRRRRRARRSGWSSRPSSAAPCRPAAPTRSTASTTATSTSRCAAPAAGRCRATSSSPRAALVFGLVLGVVSTLCPRRSGSTGSRPALALAAERVLRLRLHDAAQAAYHAEHRLGRPRRLLPGADRLDRGHRRAGLAAGRAVPGRLLLDAAAHLGAGDALPRGLRRASTCRCCRSSGRRRGRRPADRRLLAG